MATFNKILNPMYSCIASYSTQDDGSISAKYVIGTGEDDDGAVTNFTVIIESYKYIDGTSAKAITDAPLTKECIGKPFNEVITNRIYNYMLENGMIRA